MPKLIMMQGLPCSGKTEWATAWACAKHNRLRISWTDMLKLIGGGKFQRERRPLAFDATLRLMSNALRGGMDVVLDECNLNAVEYGLFVAKAQQLRANVEWHRMSATPEECKRRSALHEHPVADLVIDRMAERYAAILKQK